MSRKNLENWSAELGSTSERLLLLLKTRGPQQSMAAGKLLGTTSEAVRQQFVKLADAGLVESFSQTRGVGRPSQFWKLTQAGHKRFPDSHAELTMQLLDTVRQVYGEAAIEQLIDAREQASEARYSQEMAGLEGLSARMEKLADLRSAEGYMAQVEAREDGALLLVENHCPICAAATACQGFCRSERMVFERVLQARVERVEHILNQARRCAYVVSPLSISSPENQKKR